MRVAHRAKRSLSAHIINPPKTHQMRIKPTPILMMARSSGSGSFDKMKTVIAVVERTPQAAIAMRRKQTRDFLVGTIIYPAGDRLPATLSRNETGSRGHPSFASTSL